MNLVVHTENSLATIIAGRPVKTWIDLDIKSESGLFTRQESTGVDRCVWIEYTLANYCIDIAL